MPKLRHLALYCGKPQHMVSFYEQVFGMKEPYQMTDRESGGIHLSDGVMDLVLMPYRSAEQNFEYKTSSASGIGHIGFWFDEAEGEEVGRKLRRSGTMRAGSGIDSEMIEGNWIGPDGVLIKLINSESAEKHCHSAIIDDKRASKLNHVALFTPNLQRTAEFYQLVFSMEEVGRRDAPLSDVIFLSDGYINFSVVCFRSPEIAIQKHYPPDFGLNHFGFLVENREAAAVRLRAAGAERVETIPDVADKWKGPDGMVFDVTDKC